MDLMVSAIVVPDLVLLEFLRGARDEALAARIERNLSKFRMVELGGRSLAATAARHYRHLRGLGITMRSNIDLVIGAFCIQHGAALMQRHLGLRCL